MNEEKVIETVMDNSEEIKNVAETVMDVATSNTRMFVCGALTGGAITGACLLGYKLITNPNFLNKFKKGKEACDIDIDERSDREVHGVEEPKKKK